jgi:hypothetical protein
MILFFIRTFNDLDHITPVVYRLAGYSSEPIRVFCQNPSFDINNDFRLKFLKENVNNLELGYIYSLKKPVHALPGDKLELQEFDENWAKILFEELKPSALVFDYVIDSGKFITGSLLKAARRLNIPTIGVPPGLPVFSEGYMPDIDFFKNEVRTELDYNIVPHRIDADYRIGHGFNPDRITILGSARFCKEWREVINNVVPPDKLPDYKSNEKLKVVYMERGADLHGEFSETIRETITRVSRLDFVHLIIKPHTRERRLQFSASDTAEIAYGANSINLIKWADAVIGTNSSILVEALLQDKVLLYPKYFHRDRMIFHDMGACWTVHSIMELEGALKQMRSAGFVKPYPRENVERLVEKIVYGGAKDRDVLGDYVKFICGVANKKTQKWS